MVGLVSSTPGGIFGYRIISTRGELEGTVSFEESSLSSASVETEEDLICQREGKEEGGGSVNEGKTIGDGVETQEGKATEAVVQSPEALVGQEIACSPMHSLEAKVETECIGRGGGGEEVRRQIRANGCNARCVGEQGGHTCAGRVDGGGGQGICLHV